MAKLKSKKTAKSRPAARSVRKRTAATTKTAKKSVRKSARLGANRIPQVSATQKNRSFQPPPALSVASDKPVKNAIGLKARDLAFFRDLLIAKRRELVGDVHHMEQEALQTSGGSNLSNLPIHMADMGTDNYEQEFTLGLVEKDRQLLREINQALAKIRDGSYGVCEGTGKPISRARLEAQPWARFSIEYARRLEKKIGPR